MKRRHSTLRQRWHLALLVAMCAALLMAPTAAYAQSGITMLITTIDGGGGSSSGGQFSLGATIAQPEAGQMTGGTFTLIGGFWTPLGLEPTGGQPSDGFTLIMPLLKRQPVTQE